MLLGLPPPRRRETQRRFGEGTLSIDEEEAIARYRSARAMAGVVAEATRRAEAMARLELSLSLAIAA
jgi:hypothetical protein